MSPAPSLAAHRDRALRRVAERFTGIVDDPRFGRWLDAA
jgi:hypothetical protein